MKEKELIPLKIGFKHKYLKKIIGISAYYHDSAAALIIDGEIISAVQEERFTRKKHDSCFPKEAINLQKAILQDYVKTCSSDYKDCLILRLSMNFQEPQNDSKHPITNALENNLLLKKNFIKGDYMAKCMKKNLLEQGLSKGNLDIRARGGHYGPETNKAIADCLYKNFSKKGFI